MVQPIDIAEAVHKICVEKLIPEKISPEHAIIMHSLTTAKYAEEINRAGMAHVTGEQVTEAIIQAAGWDKNGPWPGHPHPQKVIEKLKEVEDRAM